MRGWRLKTRGHVGPGHEVRYQLTMPNATALIGATTTVQCVVFDPAANPLGLVTSDACDVETRN